MKTQYLPLTKKSHVIVLITVLSLVIIISGYFFYKHQQSSILQQKYNELKAIADLKVSQIEGWFKERNADVNVITNSPFLEEGIHRWLRDTRNPKLKQYIINRLQIVQKELHYEDLVLTSVDGEPLLSAISDLGVLDPLAKLKIIEAYQKREIVFTDFYWCQIDNKICFDIIAPIIDDRKNTSAVLVFRRDPNLFLYPLIQSWPTPNQSSETAILRVEEDSVVFLNELRHRENTALKLKIPLMRTEVPAVQAALGRTGFFEGIDYRGIPVLADIRVIPATNWIMVSKVDKSEIFSALYYAAGIISGFSLLLIVICSIGFIFIYNSRQKNIFKELYNKEKELWQHQERFKVTMESLGEGIITTDVNGKIQYLNSRAEELTGWNLRGAKGRMLSEIYHVKNEETGQIENNVLEKIIKQGIVKELANHTILITKSGKEVPVMDTGAPIYNTDGTINGIVITFHDEAEKRTQQRLIKESEEKFREIFDHSAVGKSLTEVGGTLQANAAFCNILGYTESELQNINWKDITHPDDIQESDKFVKAMLDGKQNSAHYEKRYIHKIGKFVWTEVHTTLLRNAEGKPKFFITAIEDITKRKIVEQEQQKLVALVENNSDFISTASLDGQILYINSAGQKLVGLEESEVKVMKIFDLVPSEDIQAVKDTILNAIMQNGYWTGEFRLKNLRFGNIIPVEMNSFMIKDTHTGQPIALASVCRDITNSKKAEKVQMSLYRISEAAQSAKNLDELYMQFHKTIADLMPARNFYFALYDVESDLLQFPYHVDEFDEDWAPMKPGRSLTAYVLRTGIPLLATQQVFEQLQQAGEVDLIGAPSVYWLGVPLKTQQGVTIGVMAVQTYKEDEPLESSDMEILMFMSSQVAMAIERKLAEEKLMKSEEQFRLISENVADMIAVLDLEGRRIYNSPSYRPILGDPNELLGTDSFQEIHPNDREKIKAIFKETVRTGIGHRAEYRFVKKDGAISNIESQGSVIKDKEGKVSHVVVVSRDVTEKKLLEQQFLRAQRMESIGTLAGGIAHDLNNILAPIMLAIELLKKKYPDQEGLRTLNTLETSAKRGSDIVKQVLAFGRGIEGERVLLQPKHVVDEIVKIAEETFPKNIQTRKDIPKNLWVISADPTQMHQVLLNAFVNARDAMPSGGTITVSAANVQIDENYARMHIEAKVGNYILISVADTGTGIAPDIRDRIFEPFFTTKEIGKGTGLGLSTVSSIVKSHGGFINVYSEKNKGTIFNFYFPAQTKDQSAEEREKKPELPFGKGELVLVVDDEASIREIT